MNRRSGFFGRSSVMLLLRSLCAGALLVASACGGRGNGGDLPPNQSLIEAPPVPLIGETLMEPDAEALFKQASDQTGQSYVEAEEALRRLGEQALPTLAASQGDSDYVNQSLARMLHRWIAERPESFEQALEYLRELPEWAGRTPMGKPSPSATAMYLSRHFGNEVADLLSIRLIKSPQWPHWQVVAVLLYLKEDGTPDVVAPLIRYVIETENDMWRDFAIEALQAIDDPDRPEKLDAEVRRAEEAGRQVAEILTQLRM